VTGRTMAPWFGQAVLVAVLGQSPGFVSNCRPGDAVIVLAPYRGSEYWLDAQIVRVASYDEVHIQFTDRTKQEATCPRPPMLPGGSAGADVHENCIFPNEKVQRQCLCDAHNKPCSEWVTPPVAGSDAEVLVPPEQPPSAPPRSGVVFNRWISVALFFLSLAATSCAYISLRFRVPPEPPEAQVLASPAAPLGVVWKVVRVPSPENKTNQVRTANLRAAAIPSPTAFASEREKPRVAWPSRSGPLYKDRPESRPPRIGRANVGPVADSR